MICWLCGKTYDDEIQHFLDKHGTYCINHKHIGGCDIRCIKQCDLCCNVQCTCYDERT